MDAKKRFLKNIGYKFKNPELLNSALTHRSFAHEHPGEKDNERMEFLGDSVINLIIGNLLMEMFPEASEGQLTRMRASLVSEAPLAKIARSIGLGEVLRLGHGEELSGGKNKNSILADGYEALIGAIFIDGGFKKTKKVVSKHFSSLIKELNKKEIFLDFKTRLQELTQELFHTIPVYRTVKEMGPEHKKKFEIIITVNGRAYGKGKGKSKKEAEQNAAKKAFETIKLENKDG